MVGRQAVLAGVRGLMAVVLVGVVAGVAARPVLAGPPDPVRFRVFDDGVAPMAREYGRYGGPAVLGPPVSRRFLWDGFLVQAFQKGVLQWRPELGAAVPVNVLDELARRGKDDYLASLGVPRHDPPKDEAQALERLSVVPELKAYVVSFPDWKVRFGLPTGIGLRSDFQAVRFQRAVLQRWLVKTPWANPGEITLANVGDMVRDAGLIPKEALEPEPEAGPGGAGILTRPEWAVRTAELINGYRQSLGLGPLAWNAALAAAAQRAAEEFAAGCRPEGDAYVCPHGHVGPSGQGPTERARAAGYGGVVGENMLLAYGCGSGPWVAGPEEALESWKESADHDRNQTDPAWREVGVGVACRSLPGLAVCYYFVDFGR